MDYDVHIYGFWLNLMDSQGLPEVLICKKTARYVKHYFDSRECLRCASKTSKYNSGRTSLFLQDDGPSSSDRCLVKTPEMLSKKRQYCNDRDEWDEARGAAQNKRNHKKLVSPWILD